MTDPLRPGPASPCRATFKIFEFVKIETWWFAASSALAVLGRPEKALRRLADRGIIDSGVDVVTCENVDAYVEQWKKWERGDCNPPPRR
jgi:hypothetical protein